MIIRIPTPTGVIFLRERHFNMKLRACPFPMCSVAIFRVARLSLIVLFAQEALEEVVKLDTDNSER